ncbi:MAG TPA: hypothetical protein DCM07_26675 [Planctomycetaceae bacterium]|nr:hypothetical protein [Gimesia sp.]HAH48365.1 hypothetical protein [Planctomycetaceae bacterium]HBL43754.1 hypothetical protein [Planctomycetaceae bacterium]
MLFPQSMTRCEDSVRQSFLRRESMLPSPSLLSHSVAALVQNAAVSLLEQSLPCALIAQSV